MNISRNDERILVKYVDENFNIYKCVINDSDNFVINFCKRNLEKMEKILKNGRIIEMNGHFLLKVEDPIYLEYVLDREKGCGEDNIEMMIERFRKLEEENIFYKKKINEIEKLLENLPSIMNNRIQEKMDSQSEKVSIFFGKYLDMSEQIRKNKNGIENINTRIDNCVFLPGYNGIIPKDTRYLNLDTSSDEKNFYGKIIDPICDMKNLREIRLDFNYEINLYILGRCESLEKITFHRFLGNFDFTKNIKKLKKVEFLTNENEQLVVKKYDDEIFERDEVVLNFDIADIFRCENLEEIIFNNFGNEPYDEIHNYIMPVFFRDVKVVYNL